MNRHSVLVKLNVIFILAIISTIVASISMYLHVQKKDHKEYFFKTQLIKKEIRLINKIPFDLIKKLNLEIISDDLKYTILSTKKKRRRFDKPKQDRNRPPKHIIKYKNNTYMHINSRRLDVDILLKDTQTFWQKFIIPFVIFSSILFLLIFMYILLRKSLLPLKKLTKDIEQYSKGELYDYEYSTKKDEVTMASNAFYSTIENIEKLKNSRELFIRNIFHELNTPVTKGKILAEIVDDEKTKTMLDSIFSRLTLLLKELEQMEKISSLSFELNKQNLNIQDLINESSTLLYMNNDIQTNIINNTILADYSLMTLVFKNLIDNALKYGDTIKISTKKNQILFASKGKALKKDLSYYTEAFSKITQTNTQEGFGLGLYIVNEILKKHNMNLSYVYEDGDNIFIINIT